MEVEKFRGYIAAVAALLAVIGGPIGAVYVWQVALSQNPPPETTALFGIFTGLIGIGGTYLFMSDSASRATHAAERSFGHGTAAGAALPDQVPTTPLEPLQAHDVDDMTASGTTFRSQPRVADPSDGPSDAP